MHHHGGRRLRAEGCSENEVCILSGRYPLVFEGRISTAVPFYATGMLLAEVLKFVGAWRWVGCDSLQEASNRDKRRRKRWNMTFFWTPMTQNG